jgi:hypothetical protein
MNKSILLYATCVLNILCITHTSHSYDNNFSRRFGLNSYITQSSLWFKKPKQDDTRMHKQKNIDHKNKQFNEEIEKDIIRKRLDQKAATRRTHNDN